MAELERIDEWLTDDFGYQIRARLLLRETTPFQLLELWESPSFGKMLRLDGALQCSEADEYFYHEPMVHLAALAHERLESALVVGGGDGGSAEELLKHPDVRSITVVEIDKRVVEVARTHLVSIHRGAITSNASRVRVINEDGRKFLAGATERFDVIVLDLTDPIGASLPLYDSAFYDLCSTRLRPGGYLTVHLAAMWPNPHLARERLRTLGQSFDVVLPFIFSVPMSGGPWVMARCANSRCMDVRTEIALAQRRFAVLQGPRLRYIGPEHLALLRIPFPG